MMNLGTKRSYAVLFSTFTAILLIIASTNVSYSTSFGHAHVYVPGWLINAYEPPKQRKEFVKAKSEGLAGSFSHFASWIDFAEPRKHTGIFIKNDPAYEIRGFFKPKVPGRHYFAVHLRYIGEADPDNPVHAIACYVTLFGHARRQKVLSGKLLVGQNKPKAARISASVLKVERNESAEMNLRVACDLPAHVKPADVMVRLCVRHEDAHKFRPMQPYVKMKLTRVLN